METLETESLEKLEQRRKAHSVLLLREAQLAQDESLGCDLAEQAFNLEASHISEVLTGQNRTEFEFESRDGKLVVLQPDGVTDWRSLHENGVNRAQARASQNPRFNFYAQIAEAELDAALVQEELVRSNEPATIFELSLDGSDVASAEDLRLLGRNPEKHRAYIRVSVFDEKLRIYSASKDNVTVEDGKKIYKDFFGIELPEDINSIDILRHRIILPGARHELLDTILPPESQNTYEFTLEQTYLLKVHLTALDELAGRDLPADLLAVQADNRRYDIMSSFKQRLEGTWIDTGNLVESIAYAGTLEREAGTSYPGCDSVVTNTPQNNLAKAGYLNASELLKERWVWRDGYCQVKECPSRQPKPQKVKVGPCSVCKNCQFLFDQDKDPSNEYKKARKKPKTKLWTW